MSSERANRSGKEQNKSEGKRGGFYKLGAPLTRMQPLITEMYYFPVGIGQPLRFATEKIAAIYY